MPVSIALFLLLYSAFGLGNGATFQLVPLRWPEKTGLMTGIIGAAGGIGGFYLPVILGIAKEQTGNYHWGFGIFAGLSATALLLVFVLRHSWQPWSRSTVSEEHAVPQQTLQASAITD